MSVFARRRLFLQKVELNGAAKAEKGLSDLIFSHLMLPRKSVVFLIEFLKRS
jgi:hypothetical protein